MLSAVSTPSSLEDRISVFNGRFKSALKQLQILNHQWQDLLYRYKIANRKRRQSGFRTTIRIRLSVMQGVRGMFYEYVLMLADKLDELHTQAGTQIVGGHPELWDMEV